MQLVDHRRAAAIEADDRAARANELVDRLHAIGIGRPPPPPRPPIHRRCPAPAAPAAPPAAPAAPPRAAPAAPAPPGAPAPPAPRPPPRPPPNTPPPSSVTISTSSLSRRWPAADVLAGHARVLEAVLVEHPARPALVHARRRVERCRGAASSSACRSRSRARRAARTTSRARSDPSPTARSRGTCRSRYCTSTPAFHACSSRGTCCSAPDRARAPCPMPVIFPAGGTIAAAAGLASNPTPGTLSNVARPALAVRLYGVGLAFGSGSDPSSFIFARTSAPSGRLDRRHGHAHRERQRPSGRVVRLIERLVRRRPHVRIHLHVEHLARERGEFLIGRDRPTCRPARSSPPVRCAASRSSSWY